jgi:hypothetical protein
MIKDVLEVIRTAARKIFTNWVASLISLLLYAALLTVLYLFFTTPVATTVQVLLSVLILPLAAIFFFFVLQVMGLSYVRIGDGPGYLFRRAVSDCWKLFLVSLPLILLAWLILYPIESTNANLKLVVYLRYVLLYLVMPLIAIHLWISTMRQGLRETIKDIGHNLKNAFAPRSLLTYVLLVAFFGVISFFLFFTRTPIQNEWAELWVFGLRFATALIFVFLGWLLTLGSLAELTEQCTLNEKET